MRQPGREQAAELPPTGSYISVFLIILTFCITASASLCFGIESGIETAPISAKCNGGGANRGERFAMFRYRAKNRSVPLSFDMFRYRLNRVVAGRFAGY